MAFVLAFLYFTSQSFEDRDKLLCLILLLWMERNPLSQTIGHFFVGFTGMSVFVCVIMAVMLRPARRTQRNANSAYASSAVPSHLFDTVRKASQCSKIFRNTTSEPACSTNIASQASRAAARTSAG